jgi:ubiquinone/menaquinone biosynthesis C-methylase UbiE
MLKSTQQHKDFWKNRKIDWAQAYCNLDDPKDTILHPHRNLIISKLSEIKFNSLLEIGCASGANLLRVVHAFPKVRVGGIDINKDAIDSAKKILPISAVLDVGSFEDMYFNDKSTDVVLSDMALIYIAPREIKKALSEVARISRGEVILCEFHSSNFLKRLYLRWKTGYNAYNYKTLLKRLGFQDVTLYKLQEKDWPGGQPQKDFAYLIHARI